MRRIGLNKVALAGAVLGLCSMVALGQAAQDNAPAQGDGQPHGMHRGPGPDRQLNMLTRVLSLNEDQQKGVKAILEQQAAQMRALRDKSQAEPSTGQAAESREARMTQMNQIREESDTKISALLDENQKKSFAEWQQRRKAEMEKRREAGGPASDQASPPPNK